MTERVQRFEIERLGAGGDGIANAGTAPIYIAGGLPGDVVHAEVTGDRGTIVSFEHEGPNRIAPVCDHFGVCGGCQVQELAAPAYATWKQDMVVAAFAARGLKIERPELISTEPGSRRRATFSARPSDDGMALGYHGLRSDRIVPIRMCAVLAPTIVEALPGLQRLTTVIGGKSKTARLLVTVCDAGLDVAFQDVSRDLSAGERQAIAEYAAENRFINVTSGGETIFSLTKPTVTFSGIAVELPPGSFLQAVPACETAMIEVIRKAIPKRCKAIADLFCGLGAFALPLAKKFRVTGFDSNRVAIDALEKATKTASGLKPVKAFCRDLMTVPLSRTELRDFNAVVFDPPRAGAKAQSEALANSDVAHVVAVSCNPGTLARDVQTLMGGGFKLKSLVAMDQFLYSPHVECLAVLARD